MVSYAHGRDGGQVRLTSCEHETQGNSILWTFQASLDRTQRGGFMSPADIEGGARLLLLGPSHEPSAPNSHSNLWAGAGMTHRASHDAPGLFAALWDKMDGNRSEFLYAAFLHAVQRLKGDGLCEDVLELKLGPVKNKTLRVHFRGRMASSFSGSGQVIEIIGSARFGNGTRAVGGQRCPRTQSQILSCARSRGTISYSSFIGGWLGRAIGLAAPADHRKGARLRRQIAKHRTKKASFIRSPLNKNSKIMTWLRAGSASNTSCESSNAFAS